MPFQREGVLFGLKQAGRVLIGACAASRHVCLLEGVDFMCAPLSPSVVFFLAGWIHIRWSIKMCVLWRLKQDACDCVCGLLSISEGVI
jgi:hypothetical protein